MLVTWNAPLVWPAGNPSHNSDRREGCFCGLRGSILSQPFWRTFIKSVLCHFREIESCQPFTVEIQKGEGRICEAQLILSSVKINAEFSELIWGSWPRELKESIWDQWATFMVQSQSSIWILRCAAVRSDLSPPQNHLYKRVSQQVQKFQLRRGPLGAAMPFNVFWSCVSKGGVSFCIRRPLFPRLLLPFSRTVNGLL